MGALHTSLEWRIEAVSDAVRIVVGQGRGKVILARLCPPQIPEDETWANARLMCAAPDLLAASKGLLDADPRNEEAWAAARKRVAAAIEKAGTKNAGPS